MTDERHFHPCDCDDCMNRNGGLKLEGMGVVYPDTAPFRRRRDWRRAEYRKFRRSRRKITTIGKVAA